jgi:hypothetical protein
MFFNECTLDDNWTARREAVVEKGIGYAADQMLVTG